MPPGKQRLDQALVDRGLCESREKAKRSIMAGSVSVEGHPVSKPGQLIRQDQGIVLKEKDRFVSRGGLKLEHGLGHFQVLTHGILAVDLGASTGGFTDCLLQRGVSKVYAVDVGQGQLAWSLRQDPRVVCLEKVNARYVTRERLGLAAGVDLVSIDCSFISLRCLLPAAVGLLASGGSIVALIKPQFEAGKDVVDRGRGVIRDPKVHEAVIESLRDYVVGFADVEWVDLVASPILGPAGNKEFLVHLRKLDGAQGVSSP